MKRWLWPTLRYRAKGRRAADRFGVELLPTWI